MKRHAFIVLASLIGGGVVSFAAAAADLPVAAFFGKFSGGGIAQNADSEYFALTTRDFDVDIKPSGNGFTVGWTSVIRRGGDPEKPNVRRKSTTKTFLPTANPSVFHCADSGDPLAGKELCWARIEKNTLSAFVMVVDRNGVYELQQYDRTLSGNGMKLMFRSWRDGDRLRSVSGQLVKIAN
jgi:hypothetical protein